MKTSSIVKNSKLPEFIKQHEIFRKIPEIKKIFPLIGLKNHSETLSSLNYAKCVAGDLRRDLLNYFHPRNNSYSYNGRALTNIYAVLQKCTDKDFIVNNKLTITPAGFKKLGIRSLKEAYYNNKYAPYDRKYARLDDMFLISADMKPGWRVVFSSEGTDGAWDIATMSERGIDSCQAWDGSYRRNLIGSMIDPFVGVIYITDGVDHYKRGRRMLYRAVVRYVVHRQTRRPALLIESIYSYDGDEYDNESGADAARKILKQYLSKHVSRKMPILRSRGSYEIPNSSAVETLASLHENYQDARDGKCLSYRDSGINYSKSSAVRFSKIKPF